MGESKTDEIFGMIIVSIIIFILFPIAQNQWNIALSDPNFARSSVAPLWAFIGDLLDYRLDVAIQWIIYIVSQIKN